MDDAIFSRTSIRKFTDEPISDQDIEKMMRAAMAAPSAGNQQPWKFVLTRDPQIKKALSQCSPYAKPAAGADLVIIPCMSTSDDLRFSECAPLDMGACVENILIEASSLGLGAVWLGVYPERDRMETVKEAAATPADHEPFALIAVGHPAEEVSPRSAKRYEEERIIWM